MPNAETLSRGQITCQFQVNAAVAEYEHTFRQPPIMHPGRKKYQGGYGGKYVMTLNDKPNFSTKLMERQGKIKS